MNNNDLLTPIISVHPSKTLVKTSNGVTGIAAGK
jgi:hypothetical protein